MITTILFAFSIFFICFGAGGMLWCRHEEKKSFNNGICPECGGKLKCVATDSQGGRYWICEHRYSYDNAHPKCDYSTWISYNVDKI